MVHNKHLTEGQKVIIEYLKELIAKGKSLHSVKIHPGKTEDFIEWKQKIKTFVIRKYGKDSFQWGQIARTTFFPKWFKPEIHGKMEDQLIVLTDAQNHDRKTAFNLYREGIHKLIAILKGLKDDIEINGLPPEPQTENSHGDTIFSTNISPKFNQTQTQSQEQQLQLEISFKEIRKVVEETVDSEENIAKAKQILNKLEKEAKENEPKWSTAKKAARMFLEFGRDAFISLLPVLLQVYGVIPPSK